MTRKQIFKRYKEQMVLKGYAKSTKGTYIIHIRKFLDFSKKLPDKVDLDDVRNFLLYCINVRKISPDYVRSTRAAIKFLFESILDKEWKSKIIPCVRKKKTLPVVLDKEEIRKIFSCVRNFKYLVIFITAYSAGLRIGEVASLKVTDIKSLTNQIYIAESKSGEYDDRFAMLGEYNLKYLRKYYKLYKPKYWLFNGRNPKRHIGKTSIHDAFKAALKDSGVKKDASMHTLRHSFATHLIEDGVNLIKVKELMGHSCIHSTMTYIHLARKDILNVKNPFDSLVGEKN
jgi:integrase/recombinase XerD